MIIIEMILKITGWSQEDLAKVLGVSRVSINCWLHGNDISLTSKKLISEKFQFPINFFDISLNENIEYYKVVYSVLYKNLKQYINSNSNSISDKDKILDILNRIEIDDKSIYEKDITDDDILDGLMNGYNPFTGELFDENHILNNPRVKEIIRMVKLKNKVSYEAMTYDDLNSEQQRLFDELRQWRLDMMYKEGYSGAYLILSDKSLINLVCSKIEKKQDLLRIKGIGASKYQKYGEDIYNIVKGANKDDYS